jgi:hypothetical protein
MISKVHNECRFVGCGSVYVLLEQKFGRNVSASYC